jgi:hypothetical protein
MVHHCHGYGKRFIVRANEKLNSFVKLEAVIRKNNIDALYRRLPKSPSR